MFISFFILSACLSNDTQRVLTPKNRPNKPVIQAQPLPTPSPENERDVLIVSANDGIYITNLEMTFTVPITTSMLREDSNPDFSPDGNEIVYGGSDEDIYLIDRAQTWIKNLTSSSSMDRNPRFSPDGKIIAFESNQNGSFGLFVMNKDGSQMRAILDSTNDVSIGGWSPDGEKIIYTEYSDSVNMVEGEPVSPSYSIKNGKRKFRGDCPTGSRWSG